MLSRNEASLVLETAILRCAQDDKKPNSVPIVGIAQGLDHYVVFRSVPSPQPLRHLWQRHGWVA